MIISVFDKVENIVGKGEIACTMFFPQCFKRLLSQTHQKVSLCGGLFAEQFSCNFLQEITAESQSYKGDTKENYFSENTVENRKRDI